MKNPQFAWVALFVPLAWLCWRRMESPRAVSSDPKAVAIAKGNAPTRVENDHVKIFQRAFWTRPASDDKILHAERREWSGADGLEKWEWFLVVEPSPALIKHLLDDNAFGLFPASSAAAIGNPPDWFRFEADEVSVLRSPRARLQLMFSKDQHTLYATDSGLGFRRGAPEPIKPTPQKAPVPGRLPTTPPPHPER